MNRDDEFCDRDYPFQEYMHVQQRHWRLERAGWVVFLVIVLLALLGVFSQGVLSLTTARSADAALAVDYQRFERNSAASEITVRLRGEPGQATGQALLGDDYSVTNAVLVIVSLITFDLLLSLLKGRSPWIARHLEGEPMIVVEHGQVLPKRMAKSRISESDILEAARISQGIDRLDQIKSAILERNGQISVIPRD